MPAPQFKLNQAHKIVAKMAGQDTMQVSQMNAGGKRPAQDWVAMEMVELLWVVKWTGTGRMPVRPMIVFKHDSVIPQGSALVLAKP